MRVGRQLKQRGDLFREAPGCGGLCDDRQRAFLVHLPQKRTSLSACRQHPDIRRRAIRHPFRDAERGAHRHAPDARERIALRFGRSQHSVERGLLMRSAVQGVSKPFFRVRQSGVCRPVQHPQP